MWFLQWILVITAWCSAPVVLLYSSRTIQLSLSTILHTETFAELSTANASCQWCTLCTCKYSMIMHGVYNYGYRLDNKIIYDHYWDPLTAKCSDELSISREQLHAMIVCYTHCTTTVNGHTMWIANLPWCSTLNYQIWHEYIRTCVEHLLGISNEHITWWVNLMIGEYINIPNCITDVINLVYIWIWWLNLSVTRILLSDDMAVPERSSNCPLLQSHEIQLTQSSYPLYSMSTLANHFLDPTVVCDTTFLFFFILLMLIVNFVLLILLLLTYYNYY